MNVYMARQPIFDTENHVYGYELLYRSNGKQNEYNGIDGTLPPPMWSPTPFSVLISVI